MSELVKALRLACGAHGDTATGALLKEAADHIEDLTVQIEGGDQAYAALVESSHVLRYRHDEANRQLREVISWYAKWRCRAERAEAQLGHERQP